METQGYCFIKKPIIWVLFLFLGLAATSVHGQGLRPGFYGRTCPRVESIVRSAVVRGLSSNPRIAPGILRLHFHDCFVRGCDGSVLINGTTTERDAPPNIAINGYNVIEDAKTQLEAACPGVVSCADILALAARDSVVLTRGFGWVVPTGRRDGRVSIRSEALTLPGPFEQISSQISKLANIGLNTQDLVALVGSHTIGSTSCALISSRLFNFTNGTATGADPTIDPTFLPTLRAICPQGGDPTRRVILDNGSGATFDLSYFNNLRRNRGVLQSDAFLWNDPATQPIVIQFLTGRLNFAREFARSMVKMGNVGVLTGTNGEIRRVCSVIN